MSGHIFKYTGKNVYRCIRCDMEAEGGKPYYRMCLYSISGPPWMEERA